MMHLEHINRSKPGDSSSYAGGDILKYLNGGDYSDGYDSMDTGLMRQLNLVTFVKIAIIVLLLIAIFMIIQRIFKITFTRKGKGAVKELSRLEKIRKKERMIMIARSILDAITNAVNKSPFRLTKSGRDELQYKLSRADIKGPDGHSTMKADTFNAIEVVGKMAVCIVGIVIILFVNITFGALLIAGTLVVTNTVVEVILNGMVATKDEEIKNNFASFYLMVHYVLLRGDNLVPVIQQYDKTTESKEMHRFVDVCLHNINTYGAYTGSNYIGEEYRGVNEVVKLMRLIRQSELGGDISQELDGFKQELINEEAYRGEQKINKALKLGDVAKLLTMILLVQAVISAMMVYLDDFKNGASLF